MERKNAKRRTCVFQKCRDKKNISQHARRSPNDEETSWFTRLWSSASSEKAERAELALIRFGITKDFQIFRTPVQVRTLAPLHKVSLRFQ